MKPSGVPTNQGIDAGEPVAKDMLEWYSKLVEQGKITADDHQLTAANELHNFALQLTNPAPAKRSSLFSRKKTPETQGLYIYGKVGRGKTLLMDGFYLTLPEIKKKRVHFHSFMRHFHQQMGEYQNSQDKGLELIAAKLAQECRILCFDEFHISDIADAMIMKRLLSELLKRQVKFVLTSNYAPEDLYPNGLARHLFVPAIKMIVDSFSVVKLDGPSDYRELIMGDREVYFHPNNPESNEQLSKIFDQIACGIYLDDKIVVQGRTLNAVKRTSDAIWFTFDNICREARSQIDYLRLAERFGTIVVSSVPQFTDSESAEAARRFTWLVDVLYDRKIKLVLGAAVPLAELYSSKHASAMNESGRTLSRLMEMQSSSYMQAQALD